jgi:parvulin-like peptidyl-prolyl isomerase
MKRLHLAGIALSLVCGLANMAVAQGVVVATVNGEEIRFDDWLNRLKGLRGQSFLASANPLRFRSQAAGELALDSIISEKLLIQYASKTSLVANDREVDAEFLKMKEQPAIQDGLKKGLINEEDVKRDLRVQRTLYNVATINQSVSADEVKAYYEKRQNQFGKPERFKIAIIRATGPGNLKAIQDELQKGTPFGQVAATLSEDAATKKNGGELPLLTVNDPGLPAYIRDEMTKLKLGEVSKPLSVPVAGNTNQPMVYFLIRLIGKEDKVVEPFDKIKDRVERMALLEKIGGLSAAEKKIDEFRKQGKVVILMKEYEDMYSRRDATEAPTDAETKKP